MSEREMIESEPEAPTIPAIQYEDGAAEHFYVKRVYCRRCQGGGRVIGDFNHRVNAACYKACPDCSGVGYSEYRTRLALSEVEPVRAAIDWYGPVVHGRR